MNFSVLLLALDMSRKDMRLATSLDLIWSDIAFSALPETITLSEIGKTKQIQR